MKRQPKKAPQKIALLSVFNKVGIEDFARNLIELGWTIISSGGTYKTLRKNRVPAIDIAKITGKGPILGHRVVTLYPHIHGGLLATPKQRSVLGRLGFPYIDLVCVDLYPLKEEITKQGSTPESVLEKTDIGGPTMLRSAAKGRRIVICDPKDRVPVLEWLEAGSPDDELVRRALAAKAELVVADYCQASGRYSRDTVIDAPMSHVSTADLLKQLINTSPNLLLGRLEDGPGFRTNARSV